jgi:alpha-ketoglutarate-dependent taurine dioxygenase
MHGMHDAAA